MTLLDFNWISSKMRKANPVNNWIPVFYWIWQTSTFGANPVKIQFIRLRTCFFEKEDIKVRTTQHGGREGEQEQVSMWFMETTVCFSPEIDRQSFSVVIVRGLCDDWSKMNSAALGTDEQNALSLWSAERLANFVEDSLSFCEVQAI